MEVRKDFLGERKVIVPATSRNWDPLDCRKVPVSGMGPVDRVVYREWSPAPVLAAGSRGLDLVVGVVEPGDLQ